MKRKMMLIGIMVLLSFSIIYHSCSEQYEFIVKRIGQIISFNDNSFSVEAPEDGHLTITIRDDNNIYRILEEDIKKGKYELHWDGCGFNQERLSLQTYHIEANLKGKSGEIYTVGFNSPVEYCGQSLCFALPSSNHVFLSDPGEWFLEAKTILTGTIQITFFPEGKDLPVVSIKKPSSPGKIMHYTFSQLIGKKNIEPGKYRMVIFEISKPAICFTYPVQIMEERPALKDVFITGDIMPQRDWNDDQIWNLMMQASIVVDIDYTDHQNVYEEKNQDSTVLGTLHGQTQCVSVLSLQDDWAKIGAWNHEEGKYIEGWVPLIKLKVENPNGDYGLLLDKKTQELTVFYQGKRIETLLVSTGRMEKDQYYQETAAGSFLTGLHRVDFSTQGYKYDFVIQYDGGNLLHQIPYAWGGKKDFTAARGLLGSKGSHACIRIQAEPGGMNGINAYWIWTHIPYHTRLFILDDPEEREKEKSLISELIPEFQLPSAQNMHSESADERSEKVVLTFCGDAVIGGREAYYSQEDSFMAYINKNGMAYPFSSIIHLTETDDLTSINLECVIKQTKEGEDTKKEWRFRGLPEYIEVLNQGSIELVNLANNHTIDYGEEGYQSTVRTIENKFYWCGNEHPCTLYIKGHLFGFGSCRETTYLQDPDIIRRDIEQLKEMGCEMIVYQCHWGKEYDTHHSALQEAMARACSRAGANLVIGHHPHVVQGIDIIGKMPVVYSLGNLIFGGTIHLKTYDALIAQATFSFDSEDEQPSISLIPILTSASSETDKNDYQPIAAEGADMQRILITIQQDTPFPITEYISQ